MHGRLKVKTTEEQQRAKEAERAKKLKLYNAATTRAFQKRNAGELDTELLEVTSQVLQLNPDFYTFWNIRKEVFLHWQSALRSNEDLQKMFIGELDFLEACLKVNPKSYGTWHHRRFVMDHMPQPDWARELQLCNLFLQYDERNFHCWDYRRLVVKRSNVSMTEEFDFTTSKISTNFSNYSSWHYRSKLLPVLHPDPSEPSGVDRAIMETEYELVRNGLYTDPDDQSNWFYHRWLLGRGRQKQKITHLLVSRSQSYVLVSFAIPCQLGIDTTGLVKIKGSKSNVIWKNHCGSQIFSTLWVGHVDREALSGRDVEVAVEMHDKEGQALCQESVTLAADSGEAFTQWSPADVAASFRQQLSSADKATLMRELDSIMELQQMETNNKWAMLTVVLLMMAVDPSGHQGQILALLQELQSLDVTRCIYYCDLRSRFFMERCIEELGSKTELDLSGRGLTAVVYPQLLPLVQDLDLSENELTQTPHFSFFQRLQKLNLAKNKLKSCRGLSYLPCLQYLDLSGNCILLWCQECMMNMGVRGTCLFFWCIDVLLMSVGTYHYHWWGAGGLLRDFGTVPVGDDQCLATIRPDYNRVCQTPSHMQSAANPESC